MNDKQILESLVKKYGQAFILNELKRSTYRSAYSKALQQGRKKQASKFFDAYKNTPDDRYNFYLEKGMETQNTFDVYKIMLDRKCVGIIVDYKDGVNDVVVYDTYDNAIFDWLDNRSTDEYRPNDFVDFMDGLQGWFKDKRQAREFANIVNEFIDNGYGKEYNYDWHHFAEL